MKKNFISLSAFAVWMLSATMLTACGDEVQTPEKVGTEPEIDTETTASTIFSTGNDDTRTSMDTGRKFYWSEGDQIYVNTEGTTYKKTSSSRLYDENRKADFVLSGVKLTHSPCSVMYIGNGTTAATTAASDLKVKIESTQTQSQWGNSDHLGASGDCGVAEATRDDATGKYSFKLKHKAAYLVFQPYKPSAIPDDVKLLKIEIVTDGTKTLSGKYPFGTGELGTGTSTSNTVTLLCNGDGSTTGGFDLGTSASAANSCFAVIQPGQHSLTIRYTYVMPQRYSMYCQVNDDIDFVPDQAWVVTKKITTISNYAPNSVTTIRHEVGPFIYQKFKYYQWGASSEWDGTSGSYDSTTSVPNQLEMTSPVNWAALPNINEMSWYVLKGDIY